MAHHLTPGVGLLCKLASIAVHADEATSPDGHEFDRVSLANGLRDAEVQEWLGQMAVAALAPQRRVRPG